MDNKAYLIEDGGDIHEVSPINPSEGFRCQELYKMLECRTIQKVELHDGRIMLIDENSKERNNPIINKKATELFQEGRLSSKEYKEQLIAEYGAANVFIIDDDDEELTDVICGHVLVCPPNMFR